MQNLSFVFVKGEHKSIHFYLESTLDGKKWTHVFCHKRPSKLRTIWSAIHLNRYI